MTRPWDSVRQQTHKVRSKCHPRLFPLQPLDPDQVLPHLGQPLLAFVLQKHRPVLELLVDDLQRRGVVSHRQLDPLPQPRGHVRSFDGLHVEIQRAFDFFDGGIAGAGEGAGLAVAEPRDVELVAAEVLRWGSVERSAITAPGKVSHREYLVEARASSGEEQVRRRSRTTTRCENVPAAKSRENHPVSPYSPARSRNIRT